MSEPDPMATHEHKPDSLADSLVFLKRIRSELHTIRKVRVWTDRVRVYDVNGDSFELVDIGYGDGEIVPILEAVNTVFKPESIHTPINAPFKEFQTGKRYPWAQDRVM